MNCLCNLFDFKCSKPACVSLHLSSLFTVFLLPTLSWRVFYSLASSWITSTYVWLSVWSELVLIFAFTAGMKTFFSYFMTSTNLKGSGRYQPTTPPFAAGSPSFPNALAAHREEHRARRHAGMQVPCSFAACIRPHWIPFLTRAFRDVPWSDVTSYSTATARFPASTFTLFPDELWTLLPLTAFLNFNRETSKDHYDSSMCCTSLFYSQPPRFILHACDRPAFLSHGR